MQVEAEESSLEPPLPSLEPDLQSPLTPTTSGPRQAWAPRSTSSFSTPTRESLRDSAMDQPSSRRSPPSRTTTMHSSIAEHPATPLSSKVCTVSFASSCTRQGFAVMQTTVSNLPGLVSRVSLACWTSSGRLPPKGLQSQSSGQVLIIASLRPPGQPASSLWGGPINPSRCCAVVPAVLRVITGWPV